MTALSNSYRIQNYHAAPFTGLNNQYSTGGNMVISVNYQSTLIKEYGNLSYTNRLEIQKVKSFSELGKNWDSYDAEEISSEVINKAIDLIKEIDTFEEEVYFSSPGPNGEVMVQIKKEEKEVELIVYQNKLKYVTFNKNNFEKQGEFSSKILAEIVEWLNI